jgi:mycothiol synthase
MKVRLEELSNNHPDWMMTNCSLWAYNLINCIEENNYMNIRVFTKDDYPAIASIHNSLNIVWPERPHTPEGWAEAERNRNPKCKYQRWVAVEGGEVVGVGSYGQNIFEYHPQRFNINVEVAPDHQRQGIGAALYDQIMAGLEPFDPRILRADAFANIPQGFRFLLKRGFYEAFRETPVHLDVTAFDPSPYAELEATLLRKGIAIQTLHEMKSDPDRDRKLYDLYWEATEDVPHEDLEVEKQGFDVWVKWGLNDPTILHDAYFIAVRGDEYIGLRELGKDPDSDQLLGGLLGVRRAYRGQDIGLAMQLRGIAYAREHGCRELKTCTGVQNAPMQALFNKLGYARDPEWQQCQKNISQ